MIGNVTSSYDQDTASGGIPLDAVVFDKLMMGFAPFETAPKLLVGVSGGADSMALALLAHDWSQARGGHAIAVTVDHGLRKEASDEARWVAGELARYGIKHITKVWQGAKPTGAVQEKARQARYQIFDDLMYDTGIFHLLVAHHADDQDETIVMRRDRGATGLGQAGMSARRYLRHGRLLRPLLGMRKNDLVATLMARGQGWIEDPSNRDEKFERVRIRKALETEVPPVLDGKQETANRLALEKHIGRLLAAAVILHSNGVAILDPKVFFAPDVDADAAMHALGQVVRTVGGGAYMPAMEKLRSAIDRLAADTSARISLGGCVLHGRKGGVCVYREFGRMGQDPITLDTESLPTSGVVRFDNRFEWHADDACLSEQITLWIGPLGLCDVFHTKSFRAALCEIAPFIGNLPRAALASMPALYDKEGLLSVGGLEVSELSDVLSAAGCGRPLGRGLIAPGGSWLFAPQVPLWESGFKSSPKPDNLLA
ncbi:tRNA lysidine(34) synthetase TilS [Thalassospira sp. HF15]|uniref:tRNA lysidine(34) synthetase TilS n=1 Tax=Thalassospira sp. HF15 TaxID=2722755 RepID=UPI0014309366|nr:tRNA lysidine(34) synthetase TilS [Thalassospira sp. HF15]NIY75921.1 tRNA lysidine(34) synthetase TilS [Thalassospira sp. HF15]